MSRLFLRFLVYVVTVSPSHTGSGQGVQEFQHPGGVNFKGVTSVSETGPIPDRRDTLRVTTVKRSHPTGSVVCATTRISTV